jgi:hypothetical protein
VEADQRVETSSDWKVDKRAIKLSLKEVDDRFEDYMRILCRIGVPFPDVMC